MKTRYWDEIRRAAEATQLDPLLVEAVVVKESSGNTDAFRFEPDFWNRYLKPKALYAGLNPRRVSSSYGLMQIMYPVAVERGYGQSTPPEAMFVPEIGLKWGCEHLKYLFRWANGTEFAGSTPQDRLLAVLASYNGGRGGNKPTDHPKRNEVYARGVLKNLDILKAERQQ